MSENIINFKCSYSLEDEFKTVNLKWTINDFKRTLENRTKDTFDIGRDNYETGTDDSVSFQLLIETIGKKNDLIEICYSPGLTPIYVKCELFSVRNERHSSILGTKKYHWVYLDNWLPLAYISKQEMVHLLCQDSLTLSFQFSFNYTGRYDDDETTAIHKSTLRNDLGELLTSATLADVKIKSAEGAELNAHKNILTVRSAVFKAHFQHGTKESSSNVIESPFETEVLTEVIRYIYTDELPKHDEMLRKILPAADFYQLEGLKGYCANALTKKLTVDNVIDNLQFADLYSAEVLKISCSRFIKGHIKEVVKTDVYKALESVELIKSLHDFTLIDD